MNYNVGYVTGFFICAIKTVECAIKEFLIQITIIKSDGELRLNILWRVAIYF